MEKLNCDLEWTKGSSNSVNMAAKPGWQKSGYPLKTHSVSVLSSGACCSERVNWYTFLYVTGKTAWSVPQLSGSIVQNLAAWTVRHLYLCAAGLSYGLRVETGETGVILVISRRFACSTECANQLWSQPNLLLFVTGKGDGIFSGVKRSGCKADHLRPSSANVTKEWSYISIPPYTIII